MLYKQNGTLKGKDEHRTEPKRNEKTRASETLNAFSTTSWSASSALSGLISPLCQQGSSWGWLTASSKGPNRERNPLPSASFPAQGLVILGVHACSLVKPSRPAEALGCHHVVPLDRTAWLFTTAPAGRPASCLACSLP